MGILTVVFIVLVFLFGDIRSHALRVLYPTNASQ